MMGETRILQLMEEVLLTGFPCASLRVAIHQMDAQGMILCGQSMGAAVALTVAMS